VCYIILKTDESLKNVVFWDVMPYDSCKNGRFGGTHCLNHQGDKNRRVRSNVVRFKVFLLSVRRLLVNG
jgi:hypothetical protein